MSEASKLTLFAKYAWFTLIYNLVVIIWGVFLRASHSGDGCGQHWLTCQGEIVPSAPELKTVIEFSHRVTTGLASIVVLILVIWAFRRYVKSDLVRKAAMFSLIFIVVESLIGAGLVLTGNTADNWSPSRPFWAIGHLINTFMLLAALSLTAWSASGGGRGFRFGVDQRVLLLLAIAAAAILLVGSSGSLAALSNMLYPSSTLAEGVAGDFSQTSPILIRLRISHPIVSIFTGVYLIFLTGWLRRVSGENDGMKKWGNILSVLVLVQVASGAATLLLHAPIVMQLIHLFLADAVWISFVLMSAEYFSSSEAMIAGPASE